MRSFLLFIIPFTAAAVIAYSAASADRDRPGEHSGPAFSHMTHVSREGTECTDCHKFREDGTFSGLPSAAECTVCHRRTESASEEPAQTAGFRADDYKDTDRPWQSSVPAYSKFSHKTALAAEFPDGRKKVTCISCHPEAGMKEPFAEKRMEMSRCLDCHENIGLNTGCSVCH